MHIQLVFFFFKLKLMYLLWFLLQQYILTKIHCVSWHDQFFSALNNIRHNMQSFPRHQGIAGLKFVLHWTLVQQVSSIYQWCHRTSFLQNIGRLKTVISNHVIFFAFHLFRTSLDAFEITQLRFLKSFEKNASREIYFFSSIFHDVRTPPVYSWIHVT